RYVSKMAASTTLNDFTTLEDELCFLGLTREAAVRVMNGTSLTEADMEEVDGIDILRVRLGNIKDSSEFSYLQTPEEYCSAAENFGMNCVFSAALAVGEFWNIVQREPVWRHINDFIEDRVISLRQILLAGRAP